MRTFFLLLSFSLCLSGVALGQDKNQALYKAVNEQNVAQVAQLLQDGADSNYVITAGAFKMSLLSTAVNVSKNRSIVELLLKHKADVNWKDAFNSTALMYAAATGDLEMVELLLAYGADVHADDGQGNTVLSAAKEGKNKALIRLIEKKRKEKR